MVELALVHASAVAGKDGKEMIVECVRTYVYLATPVCVMACKNQECN